MIHHGIDLVCGLFVALVSLAPVRAANTPLYITDDNGVHKYDFNTASLSTLVSDNSNPGSFTGITVGPNGNLFVASSVPAGQVFQYNPVTGAQIGAGPFVFYEGTPPTPDPHDVNGPEAVSFSPVTGHMFVADVTTSDVHRYDSAGNNLGAITGPTLVQPVGIALDPSGNLYVGSGSAEILESVGGTQPFSTFVPALSGGLVNPIALTFGPGNDLYVLDGSSGNIIRYLPNGAFDEVFAALPLFQASDLAFGPDGNLYLSGYDFNSGGNEVIYLHSDGTSGGVLVSAGLTNPHFLAFAVPEPSSLRLLGVALLPLAGRRRGKRS